MLKLKRVDIQGFKSFYDRTEMKFHGSGIAAIVGPNGCGKSNISDAISWVLGEQSAKSLRGVRMEDVIFAGTREKKPLGMAQVTLTLLDPDGSHLNPPAPEPIPVLVPEPASSAAPDAGSSEGSEPEGQPGEDQETVEAAEISTAEPAAETLASGNSNGISNGTGNNVHGPNYSNGNGNGNGNGHVYQTAPRNQASRSTGKPEEITITRRLYRSGDSDYLINGKNARLRDIQDLFSGTGLGPESYAIIEQGRIGQILSNKPADRRAVIEEAAGIGKYKTRKRLAESKLESSRQNLSRVFDILEEVGRQANSLKRQAAKARRYEEMHGEMLGHLRRAVAGRFRVLEKEATGLAMSLSQAQGAHTELSAQLREQEQEHTRVQEICYRTDAELTQSRARLAELNLESERTRGRLELQAKQIGSIEERLTAGESETQQLDERHEREKAELVTHSESVKELRARIEEMRATLATKTEERDGLQKQLRERERLIEESRSQVLRLVGEASKLRNQVVQIDEFLAAIDRDSARSRKEEEESQGDLSRLEAVKKDLSSKLSARQMELESLADKRARLETDLRERKANIQHSRQQIEETRTALSRQKARRESLEEILSHRAYTTESVKQLFTAIEQGQAEGLRPLGVLADFVEVSDPAWEKACEALLHDELEYVIVGDWNEAHNGIELLRTEAGGRATFLVKPAEGEGQAEASPESYSERSAALVLEDAAVSGRLSDTVRLSNEFAPHTRALLPRLATCFLVSESHEAQRLALAHPRFTFLLPDGTSFLGSAVTGGRKDSGGPLALKRELRELTTQVEKREQEAQHMGLALAASERGAAELEQALERLRAELQAQEKDALALDHEQRKLAEEHARAGQRLSVARLELGRLQREGEKSRAQREQSHAAVAEREEAQAAHEEQLATARSEFEALQSSVAAATEAHSHMRAELAGFDERMRSEQATTGRLESQLRHIEQRRMQLASDLERMGVERARLLEDNIELDRRAAQLAEQTAQSGAAIERLAAIETENRSALSGLEESLRGLREEAQAAQDRRGAIEVELVKKQSDLKYLDETSRKELNLAAAQVAQALAQEVVLAQTAEQADAQSSDEEASDGEPDAAVQHAAQNTDAGEAETVLGEAEAILGEAEAILDETVVADAEEKYSELRRRIEALGPVNSQALEEYEEAQQRYDFLNTQRQDLLDSIRDTEKAIQELDAESRRRFKQAFEAINDNFKYVFRTLFGGGQGEMRLTDDTNLAESGVDIMASPPGKKLQNIALLSGGEKSLTAMALLMAIFRYTPSPFCILDEVDAPLDEPNIQRLNRLVQEMANTTQFIVITHAKRTMEVAQALYGVTMQEPGCSTLVSVRFEPQSETRDRTAALATA